MNKKRIGIVTAFDTVGNYGNKLQNYAVVKIFENRSFEVETIVLCNRRPKCLQIVVCVLNFFLNVFGRRSYSRRQLNWLKAIETRRFEEKYLHPNFKVCRDKSISVKYDYFVIGSDQVWNPLWWNVGLKKNLYLLTFADPRKKICIAPSFGISELPEMWKDWFRINLAKFERLSVREDEGTKIIKELTGKDAMVLLDPTLMLDVAEWKKISEIPRNVDFTRPYILSYFLGGQNKRTESDIKKYCENYKLVEYDLQKLNGHYPYADNPKQFIYLIEHADLVLTDSFHACVFSFLFSKPFLVYKREEIDMSSRIETFLRKFSLERKYVESGMENEIFECDYQEGFKRLIYEREACNRFIDVCLTDGV